MKKRFYTSLTILALTYFFAVPLFAQSESKGVVITVSGSGKNQDEAKQNALRNAIEQAFGTFISSNTEILNDELVKDEIVSISSGNIQEYTVISEVQTPDDYWSNTIKATVSIGKLTSFCESKGVVAEFKGSLFGLNIKQQELNKINEEKVIKNMCNVLKNMSENVFDYELSVGEPTAEQNWEKGNGWRIPITIYAIPNDNLKAISEYFIATVKGISLKHSEINNLKQLNLKSYMFLLESSITQTLNNPEPSRKKKNKQQVENIQTTKTISDKITLRNKKSLEHISEFLLYFRKGLLNFQIVTDLESKLGNDFINTEREGGDYTSELALTDAGFKPSLHYNGRTYPTLLSGGFSKIEPLNLYGTNRGLNLSPYIENDLHFNANERSPFLNLEELTAGYAKTISFKNLPIGKKVIRLVYYDFRTTDEISKITEYKISYCKNKFVRKNIDPWTWKHEVVKE